MEKFYTCLNTGFEIVTGTLAVYDFRLADLLDEPLTFKIRGVNRYILKEGVKTYPLLLDT
jgi:hypothetical protein